MRNVSQKKIGTGNRVIEDIILRIRPTLSWNNQAGRVRVLTVVASCLSLALLIFAIQSRSEWKARRASLCSKSG